MNINQPNSDAQINHKNNQKSGYNNSPYAQAIYELLKAEPDQLNLFLSLMLEFEQSVAANNLLKESLTNPLTASGFKKDLIFKLMPQLKQQMIFKKIILVLVSKKKIHILSEMGSALQQVIDIAGGVHEVQIISADANNKEIEAIANSLKSISKRPIRIRNLVNEELIAGWIIKTPNFVIDNSVKERIRKMKTLVLSTKVK
jgi:ATP synthase F1 delta subunit